MRLVIAGGRTISEEEAYSLICDELSYPHRHPTVILSGGAKGVDAAGERWAREHGVPVERYLPDWRQHGRAAGPIRNALMAENADALLLIWNEKSSGSASMLREAERRALAIWEVITG